MTTIFIIFWGAGDIKKNKKCLELHDLVRKVIRKSFHLPTDICFRRLNINSGLVVAFGLESSN